MNPLVIWIARLPMKFSRSMQTLNQQQQKTIIMVTHDPRAADHARHILHIDKGAFVNEWPSNSNGG